MFLEAFPGRDRDFDQLWCMGDLVDYGPRPHEVVEWVSENATVTIRGNHDHAAGFAVDPQCSAPFRRLATETLRYTQNVCTERDLNFLRNLSTHRETTVNSSKFYLVHSSPTDPLFGYYPENSERWLQEATWAHADLILVGHTHTPFIRKVGTTTIVNPGSLGQPKTGRPLACYALWEDGQISLKEYPYPVDRTIQQIHMMPISHADQDALISVLRTGRLPQVDLPAATAVGL